MRAIDAIATLEQGIRMDRWDPRHFEQGGVQPARQSEAAEDFGVRLKVPTFGFWKPWLLLNAAYLGLAFFVIIMMKAFSPYLLDLNSPSILLVGVLLIGAFVGGYALLLIGVYQLWRLNASAVRP